MRLTRLNWRLLAISLLSEFAVFSFSIQAGAGENCEVQAKSCHLMCVDGSCSVEGPDGRLADFMQPTFVCHCDKFKVTSGAVAMRYFKENGAPTQAVIKPNDPGSLVEQFNRVKPRSPCSVMSAACLQVWQDKRASAVGGHGIDTAQASISGEPCGLGLPCGLVLAPEMDATWQIKLAGDPQNGILQIKTRRGSSEITIATPIRAGIAQVEAGKILPNVEYQYAVVDVNGQTVAQGIFKTASQGRASSVRVGLKSASDIAQAFDILAEEELYWDARRVMEGEK